MYPRQLNVTDGLLQEKAQAIINAYNEVCDITDKVDLKLSWVVVEIRKTK